MYQPAEIGVPRSGSQMARGDRTFGVQVVPIAFNPDLSEVGEFGEIKGMIIARHVEVNGRAV